MQSIEQASLSNALCNPKYIYFADINSARTLVGIGGNRHARVTVTYEVKWLRMCSTLFKALVFSDFHAHVVTTQSKQI